MQTSSTSQSGHTLFELALVMAILAIAMTLVLPSAETANRSKVDLAATEIAQAFRFAQQDAIRSGTYRVVNVDVAAGELRIFGLDMTKTTPAVNATSVLNPIDKRPYVLSLASMLATQGVSIASVDFNFTGGARSSQISFATNGSPVSVVNPKLQTERNLAGTGKIKIGFGNWQRTINIEDVTGRVSILNEK